MPEPGSTAETAAHEDGAVPARGLGRAAEVYLARHGQTAYNYEKRFQGQLEIPLDDTGREQARELAERALSYGFGVIWSSTLLRARETAAAVAERTGLEVRTDPRLKETDAGAWTGRLFSEIEADDPEGFEAFRSGAPDFAFPAGESFTGQTERVEAALEDVERGPLPALVVCHGVVIRLALWHRAGARLQFARRVPNASIVPLDPGSARDQAQAGGFGGGAATQPS